MGEKKEADDRQHRLVGLGVGLGLCFGAVFGMLVLDNVALGALLGLAAGLGFAAIRNGRRRSRG